MSGSRTGYKNQPDNQDSSLLLSVTPREVRDYELYPRFPMVALGLFAQTSQQAEAETALLRLGLAAIYAAPEFMDAKEDATALAAIAILKRHPELLFEKKQMIDHYGRKIYASPYQLFLGAGDVWAIKQVHTDIFPLISDGEEKAKTQFEEQFPNYDKELAEGMNEEARFYDNRNTQQIEAITKQLATVKQLIEADPFINKEPLDTTKQAVETLCKLFQPKPGEIIRSGLHLPLAIIKEVYKTYNALQCHWSYFSWAVIGPALDALSIVDGQCCQQGLKNLVMDKGPNRYCLSTYRHSKEQPLNVAFVNDDALGWVVLRGFGRRILAGWKTYGEQKQKFMGAIMQPCFNPSTHCLDAHAQPRRCVIC